LIFFENLFFPKLLMVILFFYDEDRACSDADTCSLSNFIEQLVTQEAFERTKAQKQGEFEDNF
jgi:hypothetical protein